MIVPGMLVYSSFLIRVCMFIVSKALLISSATLIVRAGGVIWLNPFSTVLRSAVTVECCVLYPCAWVCLVCLLLCKEEGSSPVSLQLLRGVIWACMRCPCLCWVLGWGLCYPTSICVVLCLVLRAVFNMLVRNASTRGPMCFRCLMVNLSGPCELLFLLCFIVLDLSCGECDVISVYFMCCSVSVSVWLVCCVFDIVCELFGETIRNMFGYGCYLVVECYGCVLVWVEVLLLDRICGSYLLI